MFAIAFDLIVADTEIHHPKGTSAAYAEIGATLAQFGFRWVQGSLYVTDDEDERAECADLVSDSHLTFESSEGISKILAGKRLELLRHLHAHLAAIASTSVPRSS